MNIRSNWRIITLSILLVLSVIVLSPIGSASTSNPDSLDLNLSYGLDLSGGTRLRAPIVGWTAEEVSFIGYQESNIEETILSQFPSLSRSDVDAKIGSDGIGTFEIFSDISVVTGYKAELIDLPNLEFFHNKNFETTNMVESLFCALKKLNESTIFLKYFCHIKYNQYSSRNFRRGN